VEVITERLSFSTKGNSDIVDITTQITECLQKHKLTKGAATVFVTGSTAGVTTTEFEPGLLDDIPAAFERFAPSSIRYHHDDTWHDGNGHAHVRAALLGPSLTVPFVDGKLTLGTWQQIVLVDFDTRPRNRELIIQMVGQ
jgi:secondary thiamine-phosphate synthase enzyme